MNDTPLNPTLILAPIRQAAPANGGTLEVLLRVQAPDRAALAAPARQPLRLAVVIDRSGSMAGEPLQEALRCAEYIANGLQPVDSLSVVLYDDQVQVPVALRPGAIRPRSAWRCPASRVADPRPSSRAGRPARRSWREALQDRFLARCCFPTDRPTTACARKPRSRSNAPIGPRAA